MIKVYTYFDNSIKKYFNKSIFSIAACFQNTEFELIILSDYKLPNSNFNYVNKYFDNFKIVELESHNLENNYSNQAFIKVLFEYIDDDRFYIDPTLFVINNLQISNMESVFYKQHQGKISTKLCFLKKGDQFKIAFSSIRRNSYLQITDTEFTYAIYRNFLINKKLSNLQLVNGALLNSSNISNLNLDRVIAFDLENTTFKSTNKTTKYINDFEKNKKLIKLTKHISKVKHNIFEKSLSSTTTTTTEDPTRYPFSILITAYNTADYIEECLDSIEKQTYFIDNNEFEILIGVDHCEATLSKLKEIHHKYRNLNVYMMDKNVGTYITTNTLISLAKYDNIIRFDSDDIMRPFLVKEVAAHRFNDIVRLSFNNFQNKTNQVEIKTRIAHGTIYFRKAMMDSFAGGYMPWKCGADTELIHRLGSNVSLYNLEKSVFYRRLHSKNLTLNPETGLTSELRNSYKKQIKKEYSKEEIYIPRITTKFTKEI